MSRRDRRLSVEALARLIKKHRSEPGAFRAAFFAEHIKSTAAKPCCVCGRDPAESAATFRPKNEDAARLGWPPNHDRMLAVPLCQDCDARCRRDLELARNVEQALINHLAEKGPSESVEL